MIKKLKSILRSWALRDLLAEEAAADDRLLNFHEGAIPKLTDGMGRQLEYFQRLEKACLSPEGQMIFYRMQLLYNSVHDQLRKLDLAGSKDRQIEYIAKLQALYHVLREPANIQRRVQKLQIAISRVQEALRQDERAGQTPAGKPVWAQTDHDGGDEADALFDFMNRP